MMENLAPAGNREALDRAVAAGADAVYLGYAAFSARATAGNFDEEGLREAVRFAHLHHVRVYVTVNTLIKDGELDAVLDVLRFLNGIPVDAVIVQDLGVLSLARRCFPDLPVHASTQMAIHNASGAAWCAAQGMERVVLARECSLEEIEKAAEQPIQVEVFGHGAQCVGVSGQCLFSSMVGGRSGNRGRCAQPCRMQYTLDGRTAAWLSPRDVCLRNEIPALSRAGVSSLKLEGRLKRPEYVACVASSYRKGIDSMEAGRFLPADRQEEDELLQIFQRGGFMRGYAMGCEDAGVICEERVNHGGLPMGVVEAVAGNMARVKLTRALHDGDGMQFRTAHGDQETIYAGHDQPAGTIAVIRLRPDMRVRAGDEVVRLTDSAQLEAMRAIPLPRIPVDMRLVAMCGQPLTLTATDGETAATAIGDMVQPAQKRAMSEDDARRSLEKTGDTPFVLRSLTVETDSAFVPVSVLNSLRRDALEQLTEARAKAFARADGREMSAPDITLPQGGVPDTIIVRTMEQMQAARDANARIVWYPEDFREEMLETALADMPEGVWLQLPCVCEQATLEMLHAFAARHADRLGGVVLGSVGQLGLRWTLPLGAGTGVPVMNRRAAQLLFDAGCEFVTASPELTGAELNTLMQDGAPILIPAYGRVQLMLLHHCPARTALGLKEGHAACAMCDKHAPESLEGKHLTDRKGYAFPLLRQRLPEGCLVRVMNALPTDNMQRAAKWPRLMEMTDEDASAAEAAVRLLDGERLDMDTTAGHWNRPVE